MLTRHLSCISVSQCVPRSRYGSWHGLTMNYITIACFLSISSPSYIHHVTLCNTLWRNKELGRGYTELAVFTSWISPLFSPLLVVNSCQTKQQLFFTRAFSSQKWLHCVFSQQSCYNTEEKASRKNCYRGKNGFFKREFYNDELPLSLFDTRYITKLLLKYWRETGENLAF